MSVKRADLVKYFEQNGYSLLREGAKHAIYSNGAKTIPIKRHRTLDRITANALLQAGGLGSEILTAGTIGSAGGRVAQVDRASAF